MDNIRNIIQKYGMHIKIALVYLIIFSSFVPLSSASVVMPDDGPYFRVRRDPILYIYDPSSRDVVGQISAYTEAIRANYDNSFNWNLDEEEDLILTSPAQQVTNAYATVSPNIKSVWYPSGAGALDHFAQSSWFLTLATHETAHLYQLNAKGSLNARLKRIFGNSLAVIPFVWPFVIHPNQFTPTFLIEGNAVFNESRANMGGRLHSGEIRALVLAQIGEGQIDANRLINNEWRFPYGNTAYYQGGYFQAHLASKFGVDRTNQFFLAQGDHYLWPLILNKTFRDHFGSSYPQEIREYVREMQGLAKNQKQAVGPKLVETQFISELNQDEERIYFLSSDGIRLPVLHVITKATGQDQVQRLDLPFGKVFWEGQRPLSAATDHHDLHHTEYSLYGEGHAFEPRYRGQVVFDQRAGKTVSLDAANSWLESRILLDGEPYDVADSSPILDSEGNIYYFRQNGSERVLYRNRQPVFKIDGFYAKPVEVSKDGTFYFIANTDYGSSLFAFKDNEIRRVLSSDRVVEARQLNERQFVVVEVNANGHKALIVDVENKPGAPSVYSYGFPSYNLKPAKVADAAQLREDERSYNSFSQLRYSSLDLISSLDGANGLGMYLGANFVDPLEYQAIDLLFSGSQLGTQQFLGQYSFTKYLPKFFARYLYENQYLRQEPLASRRAFNQQLVAGFKLPLLRWRHWDSDFTWAGTYAKNDNRYDPSRITNVLSQMKVAETSGSWTSFNLQFSEDPEPNRGFYPVQLFQFNAQNRLETLPGAWTKKYNTSLVQAKYQFGLPLQFYTTFSGNFAWAENHDVDVSYNPMPLTIDIRIPRLTAHDYYTTQTAGSGRFELTKVFNIPLYSPRIPIGLDRIAPLAVAQGIFLDSNGQGYGNYPANIFEWGYGFDIQVLLLHLAPAKLRFINAFDTRHPDQAETQIRLMLHHKF